MNDCLPPLRDVIRGSGLSAKKSLGQNFLLDLNITRKIARTIPDLQNAAILEIGPGPGGLTRGLLMEGTAHVFAIEKDSRCREALEAIKHAYKGRFNYEIGNALEMNESVWLQGANAHIVANLPYNVASSLLIKWLSYKPWPPKYQSLTVMLQREMAQRLIATPGSKSFGRLSILAQWRSKPNILFHVPATAFTPKPKVTSSVVQIIPSVPITNALDANTLGEFTKILFGQRRKTLKNVLKPLSNVNAVLARENISPSLRPENLTTEQICQLAVIFSRSDPTAH